MGMCGSQDADEDYVVGSMEDFEEALDRFCTLLDRDQTDNISLEEFNMYHREEFTEEIFAKLKHKKKQKVLSKDDLRKLFVDEENEGEYDIGKLNELIQAVVEEQNKCFRLEFEDLKAMLDSEETGTIDLNEWLDSTEDELYAHFFDKLEEGHEGVVSRNELRQLFTFEDGSRDISRLHTVLAGLKTRSIQRFHTTGSFVEFRE